MGGRIQHQQHGTRSSDAALLPNLRLSSAAKVMTVTSQMGAIARYAGSPRVLRDQSRGE